MSKIIKHTTVAYYPDKFCGWPANHGHWQWGDEFLVGFMMGQFKKKNMHNIKKPFQKMLARSLDGGNSWTVEVPNVDFKSIFTSKLDSTFIKNEHIIRVCGCYDHGGEDCKPSGGFYISSDKGKTWQGAYSFTGITIPTTIHNTSRTCYIDDLFFLSFARRDSWGSDCIFCVRIVNQKFVYVSTVCNDEARAVMPSVAKIGDRLVVVARRRDLSRQDGWIDSFTSDNKGCSWSKPFHVAKTGENNGNPPALIELNGKLYCAYANRTERTIEVTCSDDGEIWNKLLELRCSTIHDIGYPRLFVRQDGLLVCIYYWADAINPQQNIQATIFSV